MRLFEKLLIEYQDPDPELRRLALLQMEGVATDCDVEDLLAFLGQASANDDALVAGQARRTLRELKPRAARQRSKDWQAPSGTWTAHNVDRAQIEKLKRLGQAQSRDFTKVPIEDFIAAGLYALEPLIERVHARLDHRSEAIVLGAIGILGLLPQPRDPAGLMKVALRSPAMTRAVAESLGDSAGTVAMEKLIELAGSVQEPGTLADVLMEFRRFSAQAGFDLLMSKLSDTAPVVRSAVAHALSGYDQPQVDQALVSLVHDADHHVALWAMDAMGRRAKPDLMAEIEKAFAKTADVHLRRAAVRAAIQIPDKAGLGFIRRRVNDPDSLIRAQAIEGLVRLDLPAKELLGHVSPLVNDPSPQVASAAILALAPTDVALAQGKIRTLLGDPLAATRAYGTWALGYVQSARSVALLRQMILYDTDEQVVLNGVRALGKYQEQDASASLLAMINHQNPHIRLAVARRLGEIRAPEACRKVFTSLSETCRTELDPAVRAALFGSMARIGEPAQHLVVGLGLKDSAGVVVRAALEGLDLMGNIESIPQFNAFLADSRPDIAARAAVALWHQGELRVVKHLAAGIESRDETQVLGALSASREVLMTLRNLDSKSKFLMLLSELESQMRKSDFQRFRAGVQTPRRATAACLSPEGFDFSTVIDSSSDADLTIGNAAALQPLGPLHPLGQTPPQTPLPKAAPVPLKDSASTTAAQPLTPEVKIERALRLVLSQLSRREGDQASTLGTYLEAVGLGLVLLDRLVKEGQTHLDDKREAGASPSGQELARHLPRLGQHRRTTGEQAYRAGRWEDAFQALYTAHLLDPTDQALALLLAHAAAKSERVGLARELAQSLVEDTHAPSDIRKEAGSLLEPS